MKHIVLIGDSIFDNAGYVDEGHSVIDQLRQLLPANQTATLLEVDGDVTKDVHAQLEQLPETTTHIFVSVGGNDALRKASVLNQPTDTVGSAMTLFSDIIMDFQQQYRAMLTAVKHRVERVSICTIHDSVPNYDSRALTALSLFNEIILKEAFRINAPVIDLRLACHEPSDYSAVSPIEPSRQGGQKITRLIQKVLTEHDFSRHYSCVYT